jgi:HlyD family secretion protein
LSNHGKGHVRIGNTIMKKIIFLIAVVVLVVAGGAYLKFNYTADPQSNFRTTTVKRGEVASTITATGTVEPEEVIDIGAQVTGKLLSFGPDPRGLPDATSPDKEKFKDKFVDYCTPVKKGDLLVQIDPTVYQAQLDQAEANVARAAADLKQMEAKKYQAARDWERAQSLMTTNAISHSDYDLAKANFEAADANIGVGKAAIKQCEAARDMARRNLDYTTIRAEVDGVIINRKVNAGQTVVANMSAQSLFLLAKDLSRMQVWAQVNEADIGRISSHKDMPVKFTIDAFPNDVFHGRVEQIRLNAQQTQNVVIYTVVVAFDNSDMKVLPYLTANARFEAERHNDVLVVPNMALRWKPRIEQIAPDLREKLAPLLTERSGKDDPISTKPAPDKTKPKAVKEDTVGRLWVLDGAYVKPIEVQKGLADDSNTEIKGGDVKADMEVVIGEKTADQAGDTTNPFLPKIFNRKPPNR